MEEKYGYHAGFLIPEFNKVKDFMHYDADILEAHLYEFEKPEHKTFWLKWLIKRIEDEPHNSADYGDMTGIEFINQKELVIKHLLRELKLWESIITSNINELKEAGIQSILENNAPDFTKYIFSDNISLFENVEERLIEDGIIVLEGKYGHWDRNKIDLCHFILALKNKGYFRKKVLNIKVQDFHLRKQFEKRYCIDLKELFKPSALNKLGNPSINFSFIETP